MIKNFKEKLDKLPVAVQEVLLSEYGRELEVEIFDKYNLEGFAFSDLSDITARIFFGELAPSETVDELAETFSLRERDAQKMAIDLLGMRVLVVRKFLKKESIAEVMKNMGANPADYSPYIIKMNENLRMEKLGVDKDEKMLEDLQAERQEKAREEERKEAEQSDFVNIEQEKKDAIDVFGSDDFVYMLQGSETPTLEFFNETLIALLSQDEQFRVSLERALLANRGKLTAKTFELEGEKKRPTIANWIADFISRHGSGMFDNVVLSDYINNSENVRRLDSDERERVNRLINLYRNLKFFPESLADISPEQWEIIPSGTGERQMEVARKIADKTPAQVMENKNIEELRELAKQYEEGSLEKKAIREEIGKLEKES